MYVTSHPPIHGRLIDKQLLNVMSSFSVILQHCIVEKSVIIKRLPLQCSCPQSEFIHWSLYIVLQLDQSIFASMLFILYKWLFVKTHPKSLTSSTQLYMPLKEKKNTFLYFLRYARSMQDLCNSHVMAKWTKVFELAIWAPMITFACTSWENVSH